MFYEVKWNENGVRDIQRIFKVKELYTLTKALKYMNWERKDNDQPVMKNIRITRLYNYEGEYEELDENYRL